MRRRLVGGKPQKRGKKTGAYEDAVIEKHDGPRGAFDVDGRRQLVDRLPWRRVRHGHVGTWDDQLARSATFEARKKAQRKLLHLQSRRFLGLRRST